MNNEINEVWARKHIAEGHGKSSNINHYTSGSDSFDLYLSVAVVFIALTFALLALGYTIFMIATNKDMNDSVSDNTEIAIGITHFNSDSLLSSTYLLPSGVKPTEVA